MIAASLYNIVDRIFIGQIVGPMAISGLAITFPFINLGAAFGAAVGIGASTSISVKLGQRDYDTAENILGNTVTLNLIIGSAFGIICLIFLDPILRFFGASDATIPLCPQFYGGYFGGKCHLSHVLWNECSTSCSIKTSSGNDGYDFHSLDEYSLRLYLY